MIEFESLCKTFAGPESAIHAVDHVSLAIQEGDVYGIVGYSGAGKSTLVRCINFLERPDSGTLRVQGFGSIRCENGRAFYRGEEGAAETPLTEKHLKLLRGDMGMIFQHFNLLDRSTVFDNVAYPLRHRGLDKGAIRARVLELLDLVDLRGKVNAYPSELSGGQKQRVAIARALANNPRILLSDEATSALDPDATESILRLLKELNRKLNLTIVLITHEMAVVKSICSKVAVMENGRVVEQGDVYKVFSAPQAPITRKFVDSSSGLGRINKLIEEQSDVLSGGGTLILNGGTYTSTGSNGCPAIYSPADITVSNAVCVSEASRAVIIEGKNTVTLENCSLTGNDQSTKANSVKANVLLYQSASGDASVGTSVFTMRGGDMTCLKGAMFYVTNTDSIIHLENASLVLSPDETLLICSAGRWGKDGRNGGNWTFNAVSQVLEGSIQVDAISGLNLNLTDSTYTGAINAGNEGGEVHVTLSGNSTWVLTGDSYITSFDGDLSAVDAGTYHLYVSGTQVL